MPSRRFAARHRNRPAAVLRAPVTSRRVHFGSPRIARLKASYSTVVSSDPHAPNRLYRIVLCPGIAAPAPVAAGSRTPSHRGFGARPAHARCVNFRVLPLRDRRRHSATCLRKRIWTGSTSGRGLTASTPKTSDPTISTKRIALVCPSANRCLVGESNFRFCCLCTRPTLAVCSDTIDLYPLSVVSLYTLIWTNVYFIAINHLYFRMNRELVVLLIEFNVLPSKNITISIYLSSYL